MECRNPEGYRKALRVMKIAEKFHRPVFTFVDTPGAYPGLEAEERGQAEAIARNLREMARLKVPIITTITGDGGSGGALAIAVADRVLMMENSIYSVISPEGCASIMWRDCDQEGAGRAGPAYHRQRFERTRLIDGIIPEPEAVPTAIMRPPPPCWVTHCRRIWPNSELAHSGIGRIAIQQVPEYGAVLHD